MSLMISLLDGLPPLSLYLARVEELLPVFISLDKRTRSSSRVLGMAEPPRSVSRCTTSGFCSTARISALMRGTGNAKYY